MLSRRTFLKTSAGFIAVGPAAASALARQHAAASPRALKRYLAGSPIDAFTDLGETIHIDGVPFWNDFKGDRFQGMGHPPFPVLGEWIGYGNPPPKPTETTDLCIVGGGLGGLCAGYLLRDHNPLLLEHNSHFGGAAQAESWDGLAYSLGGAYCITPDGALAELYKELGLDLLCREGNGTPGEDPVEYRGRITAGFWHGDGCDSRTDRAQFQRYFELVEFMSKNMYPDIPLPSKNYEWILDLDRKTFKQDVEERLGEPVRPLLEAAIQGYFYSSYCAGWEEISAAAGWNFVAAEPYGIWVFPEGMATMTNAMYERLHARLGPGRLRTKSVVVDVRRLEDDLQITVGREDRTVYSIRARRAVMACPKFVCKHLMPDILAEDPLRQNYIELMEYRAYVVINVLLNVGFTADYFDLFLLEDGSLAPPGGIEQWHRPIDMVNGTFAVKGAADRGALTFYWPIPYTTGRGFVGLDGAIERIGARFLPHMDHALATLGLARKHVAQVRMTRWGHPLPLSAPNILAEGRAQLMRAPLGDNLFFVHQDNWSLPAVENTLLDAMEFAPLVTKGL